MLTNKVVIDIISPNLRTRNAVEFALQQQGKGRFELSRGNRPELVIVDFEQPETRADFRKYRSRFPDCPAVLLLNQAAEYDDFPEENRIGADFLLVKPFTVKDLMAGVEQCLDSAREMQFDRKTNLLSRRLDKSSVSEAVSISQVKAATDEITEKLPHTIAAEMERSARNLFTSADGKTARARAPRLAEVAHAGDEAAFPFAHESDIDLNDAAAVERIWLNVNDRLLGHIMRAAALQVPAQSNICLSLQDGTSFLISPHTEMVAVTGSNINLFELAQQDFGNHQLSLSVGAIPQTSSQLSLGLDAFLWKLALYTYRGLLPNGARANEPVYLRYWPNLTRFEPTPNAMRIASLWCRQPASMANISHMLNIPQKHVFCFYAAASTLGLAGPAIREADSMLAPSFPEETNMNQEFIQRLANKLNISG